MNEAERKSESLMPYESAPAPRKGGDTIQKWGYTRTFSFETQADVVLDRLTQEGCAGIYRDDPSRNVEARKGFYQMLERLHPGDLVVVTELGRLGRDAREVLEFLTLIRIRGAFLHVLDLAVFQDVSGAREREVLNELVLDICRYLMKMEEAWVLRRQREGIETARREGKYKGAKKLFAPDDPKLLEAIRLYETRQESGRTVNDIERMTGINRRTLYRYLKDRRTKR